MAALYVCVGVCITSGFRVEAQQGDKRVGSNSQEYTGCQPAHTLATYPIGISYHHHHHHSLS